MGIRNGFAALGGGALSWRGSAASEIEVASELTGIYGILMWKERGQAKTGVRSRYQSTSEAAPLCKCGNKAGILAWERFALAAAGHQLMNRFPWSFAFMQNGGHLFCDRHIDSSCLS